MNDNPFKFPPTGTETEQADRLKVIQTQVQSLITWLRDLRDTHINIAKLLELAESIQNTGLANWTQPQKDELAAQIRKIEEAGFKALTKESTDLVTCRTEAQDAFLLIRKLQEEAEKGAGDIVKPQGMADLDFSSAASVPFANLAALLPTTSLSCNVLSVDGRNVDCSGDPDDLFTFTTSFQFNKPLATEKSYRWDFGDSSAPIIQTIRLCHNLWYRSTSNNDDSMYAFLGNDVRMGFEYLEESSHQRFLRKRDRRKDYRPRGGWKLYNLNRMKKGRAIIRRLARSIGLQVLSKSLRS